MSPVSQTVLPEFGLLRGVVGGGKVFLLGIFFVYPGGEVFGFQIGKGEQQITEVAFGIDDDRGDAIDRGLFKQRDTQPSLATAGHADANRVSHQIF